MTSLGAGLVAALLAGWIWSGMAPDQQPDVTQHLLAARALLAGEDPYQAVPAAGWRYPYFYPLMAAPLARLRPRSHV